MSIPTTAATGAAITAAGTDKQSIALHTYRVARIEEIDAPDGGAGPDWRRYVLESGRSTITGQRRGSREDVLRYATECAERLNDRGAKGGTGWSPRGRKPTAGELPK